MATGKVFTEFDTTNDIVTNIKSDKTDILWSNGSGSLTTFYSSSVQQHSDYYLDVYSSDPDIDTSATVQFSIAYGNLLGDNSPDGKDNNATIDDYNAASSNYVQYRNLLNVDNTFTFADGSSSDSIYVITFNRDRYKEELDINWQLNINTVQLTDDNTVSDINVDFGGNYYNIVSGSNSISSGSLYTNISDSNDYYGLVYPDHAMLVFNGDKIDTDFSLTGNRQESFLDLIETGAFFETRNKRQLASSIYFVRLKNSEYNFSNNPSFQTGSYGDFKHDEMLNDPQVYITSVGLFNEDNELIAVAKFSQPTLKNFEEELLYKIALQY